MTYLPKKIGEVSTAQILAKFLLLGFNVSIPFGDSDRYDLIVDDNGELVRVQCKTGQYRLGSIYFATRSTNWNSKKQKTYQGQADIFAVFCKEFLNDVFIVNISRCTNKSCVALRVDPSPQVKKSHNVEEYRLIDGKRLLDYP